MTEQTTVPSSENAPDRRPTAPLGRTLVWLGIAGASAALTFLLVRASMRRAPASDETTERIQDLIDEANRLIKALDEKKHA
ncbi:MAG TPA: hypothetical protein VE591_06575 [Candidatus Acidoferrum sp.]|nr:hypothetical protein [Candidatus Acidoferrum sp.]